MRTSRTLVLLGATALILAFVVANVISTFRHLPGDLPSDYLQRVSVAATRFARDCRGKGRPVPRTITPAQLVADGYLLAEFTNGISEIEVTFHTDASEQNPQNILMGVRFADGTAAMLLGDGSVQQVTGARLDAALRDAAQAAPMH